MLGGPSFWLANDVVAAVRGVKVMESAVADYDTCSQAVSSQDNVAWPNVVWPNVVVANTVLAVLLKSVLSRHAAPTTRRQCSAEHDRPPVR